VGDQVGQTGPAANLGVWQRRAAIAVLLSSAPGMALMFAAIGPALPLVAAHFGAQGGTMTAQMIMTTPAWVLLRVAPSADSRSIGWVCARRYLPRY